MPLENEDDDDDGDGAGGDSVDSSFSAIIVCAHACARVCVYICEQKMWMTTTTKKGRINLRTEIKLISKRF